MFKLRFTPGEGRFKRGLDNMTDKELFKMLTEVAKIVGKGERSGLVIDLEGNIIGKWTLTRCVR